MPGQTQRFQLDVPLGTELVATLDDTLLAALNKIDGAIWLYRGAWSSSTAYVANDVVIATNELYLATGSSTGANPALGSGPWAPLSSGVSGPAGGVLGGTYPNPGFAQPMATQADLTALTTRVTALEGGSIVTIDALTGSIDNLTGTIDSQ